MAGFLLNGWRVFVPGRDGRPLHDGKVCFYNAGSSTPANVFSDKELTVPYGTELPLDNSGFLPPNVWLETTHLYKCVVKQKVQNDPETWQTMWVIDDVGFVDENSVDDSNTVRFVNSIAELKALTPGSYDYVYVMGYNTPGDAGAPMVFKWDENSVEDEDGHWIEPSSEPANGRWEQKFTEGFVDPRKFGAIPDTDELVDDAIVRAMLYAAEPSTFDPISEIAYKPKEVRFVRSGNYKIGADLDFSLYGMIPGYGSAAVPVTICDGVVFTSDEEVTVTFGPGTKIESSIAIVDGNVSLDFLEGSVKAVRPQWWHGNDMGECLVKAAATDNDVEVYGDVSRFSHTIGSTKVVSGKGVVRFGSPVFQFDVGTASHQQRIGFECLVDAPHESMLYGNGATTAQPIFFYNRAQVVKDSWFIGAGDSYASSLRYSLNSAYDRIEGVGVQRSAHVEVLGGIVTGNVVPEKPAICNFVGEISVVGASVGNIIPTNGPEKIFNVGQGGDVACAGEFMLVEWFGDNLVAAIESCSEGGYLTSGLSNGTVDLGIVTEVDCDIRGMRISCESSTYFNGKVKDCVINSSSTVNFDGANIEVTGSVISAPNVVVSPNGDMTSARIEDNKFSLPSGGIMNVYGGNNVPASIVGNVFSNTDGSAKIFSSFHGAMRKIVGNAGSMVSSEGHVETRKIDSSNIRKWYLMKGTFTFGEPVWEKLADVLVVSLEQAEKNLMATKANVGPFSIDSGTFGGSVTVGGMKLVNTSTYSNVFINLTTTEADELHKLASGIYPKSQSFPTVLEPTTVYFVMDSSTNLTENNIVHDDGITKDTTFLNLEDTGMDFESGTTIMVPISYEVL